MYFCNLTAMCFFFHFLVLQTSELLGRQTSRLETPPSMQDPPLSLCLHSRKNLGGFHSSWCKLLLSLGPPVAAKLSHTWNLKVFWVNGCWKNAEIDFPASSHWILLRWHYLNWQLILKSTSLEVLTWISKDFLHESLMLSVLLYNLIDPIACCGGVKNDSPWIS